MFGHHVTAKGRVNLLRFNRATDEESIKVRFTMLDPFCSKIYKHSILYIPALDEHSIDQTFLL